MTWGMAFLFIRISYILTFNRFGVHSSSNRTSIRLIPWGMLVTTNGEKNNYKFVLWVCEKTCLVDCLKPSERETQQRCF